MKPGELRDRRIARAEAECLRPEPLSRAERLALLPPEERDRILAALWAKGFAESAKLLGSWALRARPTQHAPTTLDWVIWLILAGRGWGKTLTGAHWIRERVLAGAQSIALVGPTLDEVWDIMVHGRAEAPGIVGVFDFMPKRFRPRVREQKRRIDFHTGAVAHIYTAEEPELRGPNNDTAWCDELGKWRYLDAIWKNLRRTMRLRGKLRAQTVVTTTPRPLEILLELLDNPKVAVTFGSSLANAANVDRQFVEEALADAETREGRQEILGLILRDVPGALWRSAWIHHIDRVPQLVRVVIGIDPATTENPDSDLTGIIAVGVGADGDLYVLDDKSQKASPEGWGDAAVNLFLALDADAFVPERNHGGDLVEANIRAALYRRRGELASRAMPVIQVVATKGKAVRAAPVAQLYRLGRVHHLGRLVDLEKEMTSWDPAVTSKSPNRVDALVWAIFEAAHLSGEPARGDGTGLAKANAGLATTPRWSVSTPAVSAQSFPMRGGGRGGV